MTNAAFLIRAGISLAILSALPLFASASIPGMGNLSGHAVAVEATQAFGKTATQAMRQAAADDQALVTTSGFTGAYSGVGQAADSNGWDAPCTQASVTIADGANDVTLSNQQFACGALGANHDSVRLLKRADGLYLGGKKVGLYSATEIDAMLPFEHVDNLSFVIRLIKKGDDLVYTEDWLSLQDGELDQMFEMGAALKLLPPAMLR